MCAEAQVHRDPTDSNHTRKVYPNLAPDLILTAPDQLWRADITYIRLEMEFVFLAVILDAYSRRVIGWALDRTLEDELTLSASSTTDWSIIPIAARSTPATSTRIC